MNFLPTFTLSIRSGLLVMALALTNCETAVGALTNIFYLGDSYLDQGNYKALTKTQGLEYASNSAPWGTVANLTLGLPSAGRWATASSPSAPGNNYAVCGAGTNYSSTPSTSTSLQGQVAQLLADYPHGLPANSLVVIAIGTNDVMGVAGFGGIWSTQPSEWKLGNAGFSVPAVDFSVTVPVSSTVGLTPGPKNCVVFPINPKPVIMALTQVNPEEGTVTLTNTFGPQDSKISANSAFAVCGKWLIDQMSSMLAADIKSIVADQGRVVLVLLPPTDLLPNFKGQPTQVVVHDTWKYCYEKMSSLVTRDTDQLMTFDLKTVFQDAFSDPTRYGFKFAYPAWKATGSGDPDEYMFWDWVHPSGSMHRYIAERFLQLLRAKGLTK
jgi:phospholipase/lecithinase/hemolysin